jgi:hypothetical protein
MLGHIIYLWPLLFLQRLSSFFLFQSVTKISHLCALNVRQTPGEAAEPVNGIKLRNAESCHHLKYALLTYYFLVAARVDFKGRIAYQGMSINFSTEFWKTGEFPCNILSLEN